MGCFVLLPGNGGKETDPSAWSMHRASHDNIENIPWVHRARAVDGAGFCSIRMGWDLVRVRDGIWLHPSLHKQSLLCPVPLGYSSRGTLVQPPPHPKLPAADGEAGRAPGAFSAGFSPLTTFYSCWLTQPPSRGVDAVLIISNAKQSQEEEGREEKTSFKKKPTH